jgi:hypothetical protein
MMDPCFFQGGNEAAIAHMVQQKMHQFVDFIVRQKMTRSKAGGTLPWRARAARIPDKILGSSWILAWIFGWVLA